MAYYSKTNWIKRLAKDFYNLIRSDTTVVDTVRLEYDNTTDLTQAGTPYSESNMNKIETQLEYLDRHVKPVAEFTVSTAVNSFSLTGLDLFADNQIWDIYIIPNMSAASQFIRMYVNNDLTLTNYQNLYTLNGGGQVINNTPYIGFGEPVSGILKITIAITSGGFVSARSIEAGQGQTMSDFAWEYIPFTSNVTRLDFDLVASTFSTGATCRVYKRGVI